LSQLKEHLVAFQIESLVSMARNKTPAAMAGVFELLVFVGLRNRPEPLKHCSHGLMHFLRLDEDC